MKCLLELPSLFCLLFLAASGIAADTTPSAGPATATGTWHWQTTLADGSEVQARLRLKHEGSQLTGTSSYRGAADASITNASVVNGRVKFEVHRERFGTLAVTTYDGSLQGDTLRGTVESRSNGSSQNLSWEAHRQAGINGTWKWSSQFGNRTFESRLRLKLEGETLSGVMLGRGRGDSPIKKAVFKNNEFSFEVERNRGEFRTLQKFEGKFEDDTLKGSIESIINDESDVVDWVAERSESDDRRPPSRRP